MHLWHQIKGKNFYDEMNWVPYVYIDDEDGDIKAIDGKPVSKKIFKTYNEYYVYVKENPNVKENILKPEIQFLSERYYEIPDDEIENPNLKIYYLDIEVHANDFPKATEAKAPVCLISVYDNITNKTTSFGLKEYTGKYKNTDWLTYIHCKNEETLLQQFFNFVHRYPCDVISGYNVQDFDLQYLVNRSIRIFGEDSKVHMKLSPIKNVRTWITKEGDFNMDIAGVTILDYLDIYKWYSPTKLERYTLEYVSNHELGQGKVDYSKVADDLRELYDTDWNLYVEYNIIDAYRVYQIEEKCGYIKLIQNLSLLCKCPMKFYHTQTALIEAIFISYYRRNGLCAPTFYGGTQEGYPAAMVKEPSIGLHTWVTDLDITSSYPSAIITLNMSNETYYGRILGFTEDQLMYHMKNRNMPEFDMMKDTGKIHFSDRKLDIFNEAIKKKLLCVAPCGSVFSTTTPGVISTVEKSMFYKRVEVKKKMKKMKSKLSELKGKDLEKTKERIARYHGLQNALKIILNSTYGILAVPFSRYFNTNIAEAIVSCGRHTIRSGEQIVNDLLNNPTEDLLNILSNIKK